MLYEVNRETPGLLLLLIFYYFFAFYCADGHCFILETLSWSDYHSYDSQLCRASSCAAYLNRKEGFIQCTLCIQPAN